MKERRYLLLVNDAIKTHLARMSEDRRRRLREKMEFLENGIWDAGVRVKKLRGTSRVVFEARLNRSERLLFTLGRHRDTTAIYLWGLVDHDAISAGARRIEPSNAPFLDFEELEHEDRDELAIDDLPAPYFTQESVEEKVPDDYGPQRWLVFDDEEWGRLLASPDPESFEVYLHLTREQEELLASAPPVLLAGTAGSGKTTLSVYYLLRGARHGDRRLFLTYNPLLKRMAERIYAGLVEKRVEASGTEPPRFALFQEIALESAGGVRAGFPPEKEVGLREFAAILRDHPGRSRIDPELAWEEIRSIIKGATLPLDPKRCALLVDRVVRGAASGAERRELVDYLSGLRNLGIGRKAEALLERRSLFRSWDEMLVNLSEPADKAPAGLDGALHAVVDLVAKHPADFSRSLLPLEDYLALGRKRAPNFRHDRAALHAVAEFYQGRLDRSGRWDEIDLARAALRRREALTDAAAVAHSAAAARGASASNASAAPTWDLVVCDEVQDLADVQIALLFRLAADPRSMVLTGDPRQIINPTGFRWEEVKYRFRERGLPVPEIRRLSLNFRCVGPIVRLSNALLDLKASLVGLADTEMREEWKFGGRPPVVLEGASENQVLALVRQRGAAQVILTRGDNEARRLKQVLDTELVFTIAEAKGLEFDTVLLWRFASDEGTETVWRAIASGELPDEGRLPHVRHELALLYVAVTRTRSTLLAWDGETPAPVWTAPGIAPLVFRTPDLDRLAELWKTRSSPADWEKEGDYYFERERYAAARECYRNASAEAKAERAQARLLFADGNYAEAAPLFEGLGDSLLSADCWERAGNWERAEKEWRAAGQARRAQICSAHLAESRGTLEEAAQAWEALGDHARAEPLWRRAGAFDRLARAALETRRYAEAADLFERARMNREAAEAWEKAKKYERAGDLRLRLGEHAEAARLYHKSGSPEKELRCLRQLGRHRETGLLLEKLGEIDEAIEAFRQAAAESEEARQRIEREVPEAKTKRTALKAAVRQAALGRDAEAAELFVKAGAVDDALRIYERVGDRARVARCHELAGRWLEAARELGMAPGSDEIRRCDSIQALLYRHLQAARRQGREEREVKALATEAERLREERNLVAALARYRLFGAVREVAEISRELGWHENVIEWLLASGFASEARDYAKAGGFTVTREFFKRQVDGPLDAALTTHGYPKETRATLLSFLSILAGAFTGEDARLAVEELFESAYAHFPSLDIVPDEILALLLRAKASVAIITLLAWQFLFPREHSGRLEEFGERLARAAQESDGSPLTACHAYYRDMKGFGRVGDEFERAAARLPVTSETARILGHSRLRYREAVDVLMTAGAIDDAERFCRVHRNPGLAAAWAEKREDFDAAVRYFREARDPDGAMRCAKASSDPRLVARVHEWRGEPEEALRIWEKLNRARDVQRILKKYPMLAR
ncbi:MAG: UvrD-helicase domain-containing protein [Spirochaetia bacterium]